jgi:predicted  nucleic acid-binding Zn-ribbon protein
MDEISRLSNEIKELQESVKGNKGELSNYERESTKIDENVQALEKMKMK